MDFEPNEHAADGVTAGQARQNSSNVGGGGGCHGHNSSEPNEPHTRSEETVFLKALFFTAISNAVKYCLFAHDYRLQKHFMF